jgi:hypothetical protein
MGVLNCRCIWARVCEVTLINVIGSVLECNLLCRTLLTPPCCYVPFPVLCNLCVVVICDQRYLSAVACDWSCTSNVMY